MKKPTIECCLSPALIDLYNVEESNVVIIDIFRATSTIAAALGNGANKIIPVDDVQECIKLGAEIENSVTAGERNGQIAEGLQYGNSPSTYKADFIAGKNLVLTTTNGTRLLYKVKHAQEIISGAFLNLGATAQYLAKQNKPLILACASWKDRFNLEDTLFAGALYNQLKEVYDTDCDSMRAAHHLYSLAKNNLFEFLRDGAHFNRLEKYGLTDDLKYCCKVDAQNNLIKFQDGELRIF